MSYSSYPNRRWIGSVKILYENNLEDLVAFSRYHFDHSPTLRRTKMVLLWVLPLCILLVFVFLALLEGSLGMAVAGVTLAGLFALVVPWHYRFSYERQVRKRYSEGSNKGMFCEHELEVTERDLIERTPFGEQRVRLQSIEKVITHDGYTFIFVSAMSGHVIPQDAVLDGDYEAFVYRMKHLNPSVGFEKGHKL